MRYQESFLSKMVHSRCRIAAREKRILLIRERSYRWPSFHSGAVLLQVRPLWADTVEKLAIAEAWDA